MTLVVAEVLYVPGRRDISRILCAADRRLSVDGRPVAEVRKLFKIRRLNSTVSYFGLSVTDDGGWEFEKLLATFIEADRSLTLREFAVALMVHLNTIVPRHVLRKNASGLHVTGFNQRHVPEFWFIRNIGGMDGFKYVDFKDHYWLSEELAEVHFRKQYDGDAADFREPIAILFANGDLRSHLPAWGMFDAFVGEMERRGLASPPSSAADFEKRLRWKMEAIGRFYDIIADEVIVGGGTDTFILPHDES